ncbi:MAG: hypothetical protein KKE20_06185, partial [Nanoarchaeota archaeon]|nr:hypothetical protein [Nanoarchaeota archaeon]
LKRIRWMQWDNFDGASLHYHVSVAHTDLSDALFPQVWDYVTKQPKPYFDLEFDNVSLFRSENGIWKVYKEFEIE